MELPSLNRRRFLTTSLTAASVVTLGFRVNAAEATGFAFDPSTDIIKAPKDPQWRPEFRAVLAAWRAQQRSALHYSDALYRRPDFEWVAGSYACCFLMLCDERFYDAASGRYRIKEWLEASQRDFGGFDSAVLWHACARWADKRLPTEEEWQFAAQGSDGRPYPWGNTEPKPQDNLCNGFGASTTPVKEFPAGRSPFGIYDLCGNTWEWTESERADGVNRFAILRGGSHYKLKGSHWYMDGGPQEVSFGAKCLLTWPGLDRCATVGFRCVVNVET